MFQTCNAVIKKCWTTVVKTSKRSDQSLPHLMVGNINSLLGLIKRKIWDIGSFFLAFSSFPPSFSPVPYSLHILDHFCDPLPAPTFQMLRIVLGRIVSLNYVGSKVRYQRHIWLALVIKSHYTAKSWCACVRLLIFSLVPWFVITRKRSRENRIFVLGVSHFFVLFFPTATSCEQEMVKRQKLHYLKTQPISPNLLLFFISHYSLSDVLAPHLLSSCTMLADNIIFWPDDSIRK